MSEHLYDVGAGFVFPDLVEVDGAVGTEPQVEQLTTVYYDTLDLRLAARGVTLRRRQGGSEPGWQLSFGTWQARVPLGETSVPRRLAELVSGHTLGRHLVPVAELETARTVHRLRRPSEQELAQVADDMVTGRRLEPAASPQHSWRRLEVQLRTDSPTLARSVDGCLRAAGARAAGSELDALLGDAVGTRRPGAPKTAGEVFAGYLRRQVEELLAADPLVRFGGRADSVSAMLAAVRGVRGLLRSHHPILDVGRIAASEAGLKWLDGRLSRVRDLELLRARLSATTATLPEVTSEPSWLSGLEGREEVERRRLDKAMLTPRYLALLGILDRYVADPPFGERASRKATKETPRLLAQSWRKVLSTYRAAEALPPGEARDNAWRRTRRAATRARHLAEAVTPALGQPAKKIAKHATRLQDSLNEHRDAILVQRHLGEVRSADTVPTSEVFLAGMVAGLEHRHADSSLRAVRRQWRKASKPKHLQALQR